MIITDSVKKEIVNNILNAKDKRKQVQIEADLHCISKGVVKDILKEEGYSLRILNGGNFAKKHIEDGLIEEQAQESVNELDTTEQAAEQEDYREETYTEEEIGQQWADLAIPPYDPLPPLSNEERVREPIPYTKPEILDGPPQDSPRIVKDIPCESAIIIGPHIIEDEQLMSAVNKKLKELAAERQAHAERIEIIDNTLRKYAYFCTDCSNLIESEGIEV